MDTCVCVCIHVCMFVKYATGVFFLSDFAYETMKVRGLVLGRETRSASTG